VYDKNPIAIKYRKAIESRLYSWEADNEGIIAAPSRTWIDTHMTTYLLFGSDANDTFKVLVGEVFAMGGKGNDTYMIEEDSSGMIVYDVEGHNNIRFDFAIDGIIGLDLTEQQIEGNEMVGKYLMIEASGQTTKFFIKYYYEGLFGRYKWRDKLLCTLYADTTYKQIQDRQNGSWRTVLTK
jgi:hypothetical protein